MIFDLPFQNSNILGSIDLNADKISGISSTEGALFPNGTIFEKWGIWFATGDRDLMSSTEEIDLDNWNGKVYPNPFIENLTFELESKQQEKTTIQIYNVLGKQVFTQNLELFIGKNTVELPLQQLPAGSYFLQIPLEEGSLSIPILKN